MGNSPTHNRKNNKIKVLIKILYFCADMDRNLLLSFNRSMATLTQQQQNTAVGHVGELNLVHIRSYKVTYRVTTVLYKLDL